MELISQVNKFYFNATLNTQEEVINYLKNKNINCAHSFNDKIIFYINNKISIIKNTFNKSFFFNNINIEDVEKDLYTRITRSNTLSEFANYSFQTLFTGTTINIPINNNFNIFTSTKRINNYFDLVAYDKNSTLTYSNKKLNCLSHSGDLESLIHFIKINYNESYLGYKFVIATIGYHRTPLITFSNQYPLICLVDEDTKTLSMVPCPIDKATVDNASLSAFLLCEIILIDTKPFLRCTVIHPKIMYKIDTGCCTKQVTSLINNIINDTKIVDNIINTVPYNKIIDNKTDIITNNVIQFSDTNKYYFDIKSAKIPFSNGIGDISDIKLPCLFGELEGHPSLLLGNAYSGNIGNLNNSHIIVHLTLDNWNLYSANTAKFQGNCIFIIHIDNITKFNKANLYFMSFIGPRSLVVYENNGNYYYYRGITYTAFDRQEYGTIITDFNTKLNKWLDSPLKWSTINSKTDLNIYYNDELISYDKFLEIPIVIDEHLFDALIQLTIICDNSQLHKISTKLVNYLNDILNTEKELIICDDILESSRKFKEIKNEFNKKYENILKFIHTQLISQKSILSKNHSLERAERKLKIVNNVNVTNSMTKEIFTKEITNNADEVIILNLNYSKFYNILTYIDYYSKTQHGLFIDSNKFIELYYNEFKNCLFLNERCVTLSNDDYECIIEFADSKFKRLIGSKLSLTLPAIATEYDTTLPIPIYHLFSNITNPDNINWKSLANEPIIAHYRIALRKTITEATDIDLDISVDSTLLGASICMLVIDCLENIISDLKNPPSDDGNLLKIIRGLFGFLLTLMASGVNSQLKIWEIFDLNCPLTIPTTFNNYIIYQRIMRIARMAKWITPNIINRYINVTKNFIATCDA